LEGYYNLSDTNVNNLISNLGISFELLPGLNFKTNLGYTYYNSKELIKMPKKSYDPSWDAIEHQSSHLQTERKSWIFEPQLVYNNSLGDGTLDVILGGTFQQSKNSNMGMQGIGYVAETLIGDLDAAEDIINSTSSNTDYKYNAIFTRIGYNWQKKYFINLTGRRDGSSRFGPGKRFSNFGAIGAAWIFSEEAFAKRNLSFLSFGKIRSSYGTTGNDQIGDYGYLDTYEATPGPGGIYPTQLSNQDYSWEVNKKFEAAIEFGFLKDRINFGLSWYRNRSSNQLVGFPLTGITGFTSVFANSPATVQNTGWEIELSSLIIKNENFHWHTSFNVTIPKNELVDYPNIEQSPYANTYRIGQPLNIDLLYSYAGIDPETGFYSLNDINQDGRFDYEDRIAIFDKSRKLFGGMNNNITYKNISIQFLWQFVKQKGNFNSLFYAGQLRNQQRVVLQALQEGSDFQRISRSSESSRAYSNILNTTFSVQDASFLRLKTLSIGYSLPENVLRTIGIENGKIFLAGQNLITITDYSGMDPEVSGNGTSFASLRTISCGLQINF